MTNDELKKKILEVFEKAIGDWYEKDDGLFAEGYTPEEGDNRLKAFMADALITAGLCDKNTLDERYQTLMAAGFVQLASLRLDLEKVLHRAEVAERALRIADELGELCGRKEDYIQQAEKELAEEEKDG